MLVTVADERGYAAWIGGGDYDLPDCMFDRSGAPAGGPATKLYPRGVRPPRGYLPDRTPYAVHDGGVEAALTGPYFVGRATADGLVRVPGEGKPSVTAYDGAGRVLSPG